MRKYIVELFLLFFPTAKEPSNKELLFGVGAIFGIIVLGYYLLS